MSGQGRRRNIMAFGVVLTLLLAVGVSWRVTHRSARSWSWNLGSKVIVIDAGHGGVDPGAVGVTKVLEKDVTLAVAKRVQALIEQGGGKAVMVRTEDQDLGTSQSLAKRKREDLVQRLQLAMDSNADVYLSIHANSFPNPKLTGAQVFYHADSPEGKDLAQAIQQELNNITGGKRVAKNNQDIFVLKKAGRAAVTVEVGFLSNADEEKLLTTPEYQQKLAMAIYQGLWQYFAKQAQRTKN